MRGYTGFHDLTTFQPETRQSEEDSQVALESRKEISATHIRKQPCNIKDQLLENDLHLKWCACLIKIE
jgi:hypothetical protein